MIPTLILSFLALAGLSTPAMAGVSFNAIVDYSAHEANDMIRKMNKSTVDVSGLVNLPSEASNPRIYDLSSIRRIGDVIYNSSSSELSVQVTVGLNNLVFEADLEKTLLWIIKLTGGLRMKLKDNSVTVNLSLLFDPKGCTLQLLTVTAKLDGMDVDAWGMTIFGNNYVEDIVRDLYNKNRENWENQIVTHVTSEFSESVEKYLIDNPLVCHHTLRTVQQMDLLYEPFAHLHSNSN